MTEIPMATRELVKSFPGVTALDHVSIEIRPHEILGLVGENGSGKSTLLRTLVGIHQPDSGTILMEGRRVKFGSVLDAFAAGVGVVFQEQALIPNLTVAENLFLGREEHDVRAGIYRWRTLNDRARRILLAIKCPVRPDAEVSSLSIAERQMVEVSRALSVAEGHSGVPIVLLDEPTASLEQDDIERLFAELTRLRDIASVVFVSHRLDEVLRLSDRYYVMRNGAIVAEHVRGQASESELQSLMVGHELGEAMQGERRGAMSPDEVPRLAVQGISARGRFADVTFDVLPGEIVGIVGVEGSGREAVCRALFGVLKVDHGQVKVDGKQVHIGSPARAIKLGIGYVPVERKTEGLVLEMPLPWNLTLASIHSLVRRLIIDHGRERALVEHWVDRLRITTAGMNRPVRNLSGGNQQKIVLGKWMIRDDLHLLLLDHPLRGLDVGAKAEVYVLIRELSARGIGLILIADTLEECIALSDKILTMKDGRVTSIVPAPVGAKPSPVELLSHIV
jgi:ribose transport system ATP-binding protein